MFAVPCRKKRNSKLVIFTCFTMRFSTCFYHPFLPSINPITNCPGQIPAILQVSKGRKIFGISFWTHSEMSKSQSVSVPSHIFLYRSIPTQFIRIKASNQRVWVPTVSPSSHHHPHSFGASLTLGSSGCGASGS